LIGTTYERWASTDAGSVGTSKCHQECASDWQEAASDEPGGIYECGPYEHERPKVQVPEIGESWDIGSLKNMEFSGTGRNILGEKLLIFKHFGKLWVFEKSKFFGTKSCSS